jgi:hypothetical protein
VMGRLCTAFSIPEAKEAYGTVLGSVILGTALLRPPPLAYASLACGLSRSRQSGGGKGDPAVMMVVLVICCLVLGMFPASRSVNLQLAVLGSISRQT